MSKLKALAVLSRKGGVGKSTVAIHLAAAAQASGRRSVIVDCDPQRSAGSWWASRSVGEPELVEAEPGQLAKIRTAAAADGVKFAIIDTRPSAEGDALEAAKVSDLALIVVRPSVLDLRAVAGTVEIVAASGTPGLILVNAAPSARGDQEAAIVSEAIEALEASGLPVAPIVLRQRTTYSAALIDGRVAAELEPKGKAAADMNTLWKTIEGRLW